MTALRQSYLAAALATTSAHYSSSMESSGDRLSAAVILHGQQAQGVALSAESIADPAERELLNAYELSYLQGTSNALVAYARSLVAKDASEREEIVRLAGSVWCLSWPTCNSSSSGLGLPDWLQTPARRGVLEDMALHGNMPECAFALAMGRAPSSDIHDQTMTDYLHTASDRMLRSKDYSQGVVYRRTVLRRLEAQGDLSKVDATAIELANILSDMDRHADAREVLQTVIKSSADAEHYATARVLEIRSLYLDHHYAEVIHEAEAQRRDNRCSGVLPQLTYVAWIASRQSGGMESQELQWRQLFLNEFPDHPLGGKHLFYGSYALLGCGRL